MNMAFRSNLNYSAYKYSEKYSGDRHYYITTKSKPGFAFSWNTGAGVLFKETYSIGVNVQGIGEYEYKSVTIEDYKKYTNSSKGAFVKETENTPNRVKSSALVQIRFGFHF
ncbi:MAG: hypothetical protein NC308_01950 [Clostridium sp.]|nr:hypothetical protein [Bacteroides sp.]MCM1197631.1 hypothetical protein [Clostridium sp.]